MTWYFGPMQSDLRIFEWNFLQTCLGVPAIGSFRKKRLKNTFLLRKRLAITRRNFFESLWSVGNRFRHYSASLINRPLLVKSSLKACGRWGTVFATIAPVLSIGPEQQRRTIRHPLPLFVAVSMMTKCATFESLLHGAFVAGTIGGR